MGWGSEGSETSSRSAPVMGESQSFGRETLRFMEHIVVRRCGLKDERGILGREMLPKEGQ